MTGIRIGTRGSRLALEQARLVQEALEGALGRICSRQISDPVTELVILHTKGDRIQDKPLASIGEKGVFASEFEEALLEGRIDLAVHSAKDLPMALAPGLDIAAVLPRGDVRDVLVVPKGGRCPVWGCRPGLVSESFCPATGEAGAESEEEKRLFVIGTSSRRRQMQALRLWDNVVCENIRGNVDSRLRKLQEGGYDGIILAKAGLDRLGTYSAWEEQFDFYPLHPGAFLPAACQGIIAVEARQDSPAAVLCRQITDPDTELCFKVEREVLSMLSADCSEAAAAWCRQEAAGLVLDAMYAGYRCTVAGRAEQTAGVAMAREVARRLKGL